MRELMDLSGRTAIITGGAMGIGRGIADRLHEAGAAVVLADLDAGIADAYARELNHRRGDSAVATRTDVSQAGDVAAMVQLAVDRFGALDVLVNTPASTRSPRSRRSTSPRSAGSSTST
jgi:NAD(P)-dependent dehydrogenase (short-subunit alcohol dehydrogenase family)